ncbi:hypothetical protein SAMN05446037_1004166 [Anaerovirgula multivorans]|uniref:Uncharacterized protein n=1 Tax=Anaerovirgula multivorans TaxID=312168 RepID=A0A239BX21_9FIRM|nr:hypothetical protein SAMN05446037_1004166 [Anaerovirgula multivorans]
MVKLNLSLKMEIGAIFKIAEVVEIVNKIQTVQKPSDSKCK